MDDGYYIERINSLAPYIRSIPDDDLRQEAYIGIYQALKDDLNGTDRYLINRAKWCLSKSIKQGRSVDNGFYKRDEIPIIHYDQFPVNDGYFAQVIPVNGNSSLEELVLDKICLERLLEGLTGHEMDVFKYKVIDELYDRNVQERLGIGDKRLRTIKDGLRFKIDQAFSEIL